MRVDEPSSEHHWLQRFVGTFRLDGEGFQGTEHVRSLGPHWIVIEGQGETPYGPNHYQITLGYDPAKGKFVGSFVSSMMPSLWVYEGFLENDELVMETTGPGLNPEDGIFNYRDWYSLEGETKRLRSTYQDKDGQWVEFMNQAATRES